MCSRYKQLIAVGGVCMGVLLAPAAHAALVDATYPGGHTVSGFDSYDFSSGGAVLIRPDSPGTSIANLQLGDTLTGYYQANLTNHVAGNNIVLDSTLNTSYEVTIAATFNERVVGVDSFGNLTFQVTGGNASIYFDPSRNSNPMTGSGFEDGTRILNGTIDGGSAVFMSGSGIGVSNVNVTFDQSGNVFNPAIAGGRGVFTLQSNPALTSGITGVLGQSRTGSDLVLSADGNLELMAVPLPAPVWLLGVALAGLGMVARRRSNSSGDGALMPAAA